ncbi:MAG: hypothetical protein DMF71_01575 [Acidobacteria bacterium]|nr:MAG: hypothetical protein DMF71_01575 [Acidobacteriota bacterium]
MGLGATVGADLLAVPFPKMILSMAQAISKGQMALDMASLQTLKVLANTKFDFIPEFTEVLTPKPRYSDRRERGLHQIAGRQAYDDSSRHPADFLSIHGIDHRSKDVDLK